ncbi:hypothetical protein C0J52_19987 [Blattella germanica]|nr:hypothetical protein C0J52_19987 [Blattella germanica]
MADTSDYTNGKSMKNILDDFVVLFVIAALTKKTLEWKKKTFLMGSVRNAPRSGRPSTRLGHCADVENSIQQSQLI